MNLTDKARRGSWEAMETLFDGTKTSVMHLCRVLLASPTGRSNSRSQNLPQLVGASALWKNHR